MKKFFALCLCTLYFVFANAGFALAGNLYFVKNSGKDNLKSAISLILQNKNYTVKKQDPYYAISSKNSNDYVVIVLQPSSNNYFYYYKSSGDMSINKQILKALKNMNVVYEQSYNQQYLTMFENQAQKVLSNTVGQYSFGQQNQTYNNTGSTILLPQNQATTRVVSSSQNQYQQPMQPQYQQQQQYNNALRGSVTQVAKGSTFKAYLQTPLNTATASVGEEVRAVLSSNWIYNGRTVAPQGSLLIGTLSKARHATYGSMNGKVVFSFNKLMTPDGKTYDISTDEIDFTVTNEGKWSRAVGSAVAAAAVGALVGLLIGACSKDTNTWKSTAISAGIGAGASAIKSTAEKGIDAEIPVYTEMDITLLAPFSIVLGY